MFPISRITIALAALAGTANASVYFTNFESGYTAGDMDNQNGWNADSGTPNAAAIIAAGGPFTSRAGTIGFVSPLDQNNVYVSHGTSTALLGNVNASFSALFQIQDSDTFYGPGAETRDTFGFRLENADGDNLFSFFLTPFDQNAAPETDTSFHTYSWSTGTNTPTAVLAGLSAQELNAYTFTVNFFNAGAGTVGFNANLNNVDFFSGNIGALGSETITKLGAFWNTTIDLNAPGSNFMIFDNVSLIPEPSSALLGLIGISAFLGRRRRA